MSKVPSPFILVNDPVNDGARDHKTPADLGPPILEFITDRDDADVGHWTLDGGLGHADVGRWTLDIGLNARGVHKSFKSPDGELIEVLRGISLSVAPGEVVAITGASGAGKSTLLHLLGGLEAADKGSIVLGKFDITQNPPSALARFRNEAIGFVFQFHHLLPDLSALENVAMPLLISRASMQESRKRALQSLTELGLRERAEHPIRHLSGGEQQRVAIARALIKEPRLILADEPTGNVDNPTADGLAEILLAYARSQEAMVVIATHHERLSSCCDRTLALANGNFRPRN